jgi:hypothetical protein
MKMNVKRGKFIEFSNGIINVCKVGRRWRKEESEKLFEYEKE